MIGVKAFVINAYLLHFLFVQVCLDIFLSIKHFVANRTACYLLEPTVDAVLVVNVEAAEHSALTLVHDWFEADYAVAYHIFSVFHSNKYLLYLCIRLSSEPLIYLVLCACYAHLTLLVWLLVLLILSQLLSLASHITIPQRSLPLLMPLSVFSFNLSLILWIVVVLIQN